MYCIKMMEKYKEGGVYMEIDGKKIKIAVNGGIGFGSK